MLRCFIIILATIFFDQITKYLIKANFVLGESRNALFNFMYFTYITNKGSAFGFKFFSNQIYILIVSLSLIFIAYMLYLSRDNLILSIAYSFIIGGAIGNLIDRIRYGFVVDFIDFRFFPVFNLADTAITIGVVLLFSYYLFFQKS